MTEDGKDDKRRLDAIMRGAFSGPPTPLKNIPKKGGESRAKKTPSQSSDSMRRVAKGDPKAEDELADKLGQTDQNKHFGREKSGNS